MGQSPSWEDNRRSDSQIPHLIWNPKVHYRVHKRPPLLPILSQMYPLHISHPTSLRPILILSSHLRLGRPSALFLTGLPTKTLYIISVQCILHVRPTSSSSIWLSWSVQVMKLFIMQTSSASHHFLSLRSKYYPQHPVPRYPQPMFFP
jgi:hypothetical protein